MNLLAVEPAVELVAHQTYQQMDFLIARDHPLHLMAVAALAWYLQHQKDRQYFQMMPEAMPEMDCLQSQWVIQVWTGNYYFLFLLK